MSTLKNNGRNDSFLVQAVSRNENGWCCKFCNDAFSTWLASGSLQNLRNIQFNENPTSNFLARSYQIKSNQMKSNCQNYGDNASGRNTTRTPNDKQKLKKFRQYFTSAPLRPICANFCLILCSS